MAQLKNIVILNDHDGVVGGASHIAIDTALELASRDYCVYFLSACSVGDARLDASNIKQCNLGEQELKHRIYQPWTWARGLHNRRASKQVGSILDELDPNETIVHIHSWTKALTSSIVPAIRQRQFKIILTLHDWFSVCPNGMRYLFGQDKACDLKPMSARCCIANCDTRTYFHKSYRLVRQWIQQKNGIPSSIDKMITVSPSMYDLMLPLLPSNDQSKLCCIQNPIDINKHDRVKAEDNDSILFVGDIARHKGIAELAKVVNDIPLQGVFVGNGPLLKFMRTQYKNHVWTGWLSHEELAPYFAQARCLVLPSRYVETFGLVMFEAIAQGIPVICSDVIATANWVRQNNAGWVFQSGNHKKLKQICSNQLADSQSVRACSLSGYENYWKHPFGMDSHIRSLIDLYRSCLSVGSD